MLTDSTLNQMPEFRRVAARAGLDDTLALAYAIERAARKEAFEECAKEAHERAQEEIRMADANEAEPVDHFADARSKSEVVSSHGHVGMAYSMMETWAEAKAKECKP